MKSVASKDFENYINNLGYLGKKLNLDWADKSSVAYSAKFRQFKIYKTKFFKENTFKGKITNTTY